MIIPLALLLFGADFQISPTGGVQFNPRVLFQDSLYYVFWSEWMEDQTVCVARVTTGGALLDPDGINIYPDTVDQEVSDIVFDGNNLLVLFRNGC